MSMGNHRKTRNVFVTALCVVSMAALSTAGVASAHTGRWAVFNKCPSTTSGVFKCLYAVTNGGKVVLGKKSVPIVNPVTLQGGVSEPKVEGELQISHMIAASGVPTLAPVGQPVPGGLTGLVNCKEISNFIVRIGCEAVFENGLTGVNATLELAKPASEIKVNELGLIFEQNVALQLPVKVHLENPFLGSACYVGSSSSPLIWNLTTGTTSPPPPAKALKGTSGELELFEESQILELTGTELVDNTWTAPHASGCGGFGVELILNPIIDGMVGLPAAAGVSEAVLKNTPIDVALASEVNKH